MTLLLSTTLIIFTILGNAINKIYTKIVLKEIDSYTLLLLSNACCALISLPILIYNFQELSSITIFGWTLIIFTCLLWSINGYLGNLSIEKSPVSIREPLSQLQIVFAVMIGIFIFGESLKINQIFGIFLIILAGIILVFKKEIFNTEFTKESLLVILSYTFITACVAALDKYIVTFIPAYIYLFFNFSIPCIPLLIFGYKKNEENIKSIFDFKKFQVNDINKFKKIIYISIIFFIAYYLTLLCYQNFEFALIYPILKIATPIVAFSGIIFLGEKAHIERKVIAVILATLGAIICKVF
jgi:uncharacterized membrane protein